MKELKNDLRNVTKEDVVISLVNLLEDYDFSDFDNSLEKVLSTKNLDNYILYLID